jgi:hypothetical protein
MPTPQLPRVARIVWGAMLAAVASYAVVLAVVAPAGTAPAGVAHVGLLRRTFVAAGLVQSAVAWLVHRRVTPRAPRGFALLLVSWTLGESIAVYGLVLGLVARNVSEGVAFFVWAAVVLFLTRPRG